MVKLADPAIDYSVWRLPIKQQLINIFMNYLVLRFLPLVADKRAPEMSKVLIALGRLDLEGWWPIFLPAMNVGPLSR
jgi:hypothetical protein